MFCKWCGGNIASSDTKCKRCGKEVPVLSDCGGFYDLVPNAKKTPEVYSGTVIPAVEPVNPPHKPEPPRAIETSRRKKNSKKSRLGLAVLTATGFALVVLLLVITLSKINQYANEVDEWQNDLRSISEKIDAITEATEPETTEPLEAEPETTEPTVALDPVLAEQNVSFTVKIASKDSAQKIDADLNLGDYTDTAVITYNLDGQTGAVNSVGCSLKKADSTVKLAIDRRDDFLAQSFSVSYVIDPAVLGISEAQGICKWQYRFGEDANWADLPEDVSKQTNLTQMTIVRIDKTDLQKWENEFKEEIELRCEITRANTQNGSLTIVVEGIRFYKEANNEQ